MESLEGKERNKHRFNNNYFQLMESLEGKERNKHRFDNNYFQLMESLEEERKEMQKLFNTKDTKTLKEEEVLSKL